MKRYYKGTASSDQSYDQILNQLKRAIARHDDRLLQQLQKSPWYDDAIAEIRDCMKISAEDEEWLDLEPVECSSDQGESYWYYGGAEPYLIAYGSTGWVVYDNYSTKVAGPFESWAYAEYWCDTTNED